MEIGHQRVELTYLKGKGLSFPADGMVAMQNVSKLSLCVFLSLSTKMQVASQCRV